MTSTRTLITVAEAADMLSLSPGTVYGLAASGTFTKKYVGKGTRNFRLALVEVEEYADTLPTEPKRQV